MLIIGVLITTNATDARPEGTIIKEGVLTYPAVPYLTEYSLLNLESYEGDDKIQTSVDFFKQVSSENECLRFLTTARILFLGIRRLETS